MRLRADAVVFQLALACLFAPPWYLTPRDREPGDERAGERSDEWQDDRLRHVTAASESDHRAGDEADERACQHRGPERVDPMVVTVRAHGAEPDARGG